MKTIATYYKATYFGGMEGMTSLCSLYANEEVAREEIKKDTWGDCYTLYKVTLLELKNGIVKERVKKIGKIESGRDILRKERKNEEW